MTGQNNYAEQQLEQHLTAIDNFLSLCNASFSGFQEEYKEAASLNLNDLNDMTQKQLFNASYVLHGYSSYLQDQVNKQRIVLNWANGQLDYLLAKHRDDYGFTQYTKHEAKIPIICVENSYASKVMEVKQMAEARLTSLDGKIYETKRMADVLLEKAKRI